MDGQLQKTVTIETHYRSTRAHTYRPCLLIMLRRILTRQSSITDCQRTFH